MNGSGSQSRDYRPGSRYGIFLKYLCQTINIQDNFYKIILFIIYRPQGPPRRLGRPNTGNNVDIPFFGGCSSCAR